jgi:hypothetical protein
MTLSDWIWTFAEKETGSNKTISDRMWFQHMVWLANWIRGVLLLFGIVAWWVYTR